MEVVLPTQHKAEGAEILSRVFGDPVSKVIVQYVAREGQGYLNRLSRELAKEKIASRRTIYEHLVSLESAGILQSAMTRIEYDDKLKTWVKRYTISDRHKDWVKKLLG